jgi:ribonuclease HI
MSNYYAVKFGRKIGIYSTWEECKQQITGYPKAVYKKFNNAEQAKAFLNGELLDIIPIKITPYLNIAIFNKELDYNPNNWILFNNQYYIFTDGSYHSPSKITKNKTETNNGNSGVAVYFGQKCQNIGEYYEGLTNNQCELLSILYSLQIIIRYYNNNNLHNKTINIVSDSEYSINCLTKWLPNWKKNNWKTKTGENVKNQKILMNCDKLINHLYKLNSETNKNVILNFIHVNSHTNKPSQENTLEFILWEGNYFADLIANNKI